MACRNALSVACLLVLASVAQAERSTPTSLSGRDISHPGLWSTARETTVTLPSFNQVVYNEQGPGLGEDAVLLTGIPAGTYTSYSVTFDWGSPVNASWSREAEWALSSAPTIAPSTVYYTDPGPAVNAAGNSTPRSLSWSGFFDTPYTAPASGDLYFMMAQTFDNSGATWSNISITLGDAVVTPPPSTPTTLGGSLSEPLGPGKVLWYSFTYGGAGAININTLGSTISTNSLGYANDTEIALYDSLGKLVETNDDIDFVNGVLTSGLTYTSGELAAGTYYVAVTGYDGVFNRDFGVSSNSISSGTIVLNGLTPEPASALLGCAAGILSRRRR